MWFFFFCYSRYAPTASRSLKNSVGQRAERLFYFPQCNPSPEFGQSVKQIFWADPGSYENYIKGIVTVLVDVEALVMRTYDFSEADRILVLFTEQKGKIRVVAKGVRKSKSKLAASLNLLSYNQLQLFGRENQSLYRVTQAQLKRAYPKIKSDLTVLAQAARVIELVDRMIPDQQPLPALFRLILQTLAQLEAGLAPQVISIWFEVLFWEIEGYGLNSRQCCLCKNELGKMTFDLEAGGIVCHNCTPQARFWISAGARNLLTKLLTIKPNVLARLQVQPQLYHELRNMLNAVIHYHLGKPLKSDGFQASIEQLPQP